MRVSFSMVLALSLISGIFASGDLLAEKPVVKKQNIYSGYYSREENDGKMAQASGNSQYIKFYPENRIIRVYVPYPYSKTIKPEAISHAFSEVVKQSTGSAYIRGKFGGMDKLIMAHLDTFHWIDDQVMYDCGKATPCRVTFDDHSMTVIMPGIIMDHKIHYDLVSDQGAE